MAKHCRYSLKRFSTTWGWKPAAISRARGLSGMIDLSEKGGDLIVDSAAPACRCPPFSPEPDIA